MLGASRILPAQGARDTSVPALTAEGYGDLRIGMSVADARAVTGQPLNSETPPPDAPEVCSDQPFDTADGDRLWLMFIDGVLVRVTAASDATHTRTAQNVGVGSSEAEVRAAYQNLVEQPGRVEGAREHDLIAWSVPDQSGVRFEISADGRVTRMHAGGPEILMIEGCA